MTRPPSPQPPPAPRFSITESGAQLACPGAVVRFDAGRETALLCPDEAARQGLTIVDLGDEWTPTLFAVGPDGREPSFRNQYLALAAGRDLFLDQNIHIEHSLAKELAASAPCQRIKVQLAAVGPARSKGPSE